MAERIRFGMVVACHRCRLTGKQPAPKLSRADLAQRRDEQLQRSLAGLPELPPLPRTVPCELCGGRGFLPREQADADPLGDTWPKLP